MNILSKPWFIAVLALASMLGTQAVAFKLYWDELFPSRGQAIVVTREKPPAFSWGFSADEISQLERELKGRIASLDARQQSLAEYESRLAADRAEIDDIKRQVELMRGQLMADVVKLEAEELKNLKILAKTYSTLTPQAAVNIFDKLEDATVVKILFFMKTDIVGAILQEMSTGPRANAEQIRRAASLSNMLRLFTDNTQNQAQQNI